MQVRAVNARPSLPTVYTIMTLTLTEYSSNERFLFLRNVYSWRVASHSLQNSLEKATTIVIQQTDSQDATRDHDTDLTQVENHIFYHHGILSHVQFTQFHY